MEKDHNETDHNNNAPDRNDVGLQLYQHWREQNNKEGTHYT
jgi:hypothetical protein